MYNDTPVRIGLVLTDAQLFASRLLPDGQRRVAQTALPTTSRVSATPEAAERAAAQADLAAAITDVLHSLFPVGDPQKGARLDVVLCSLRPLWRMRQAERPGVALVTSAGLSDGLHAGAFQCADEAADGTRDVHSPAFLWVGDAPEIMPQSMRLDALCPASHVLSTPLRLAADGQVVQDASAQDIAALQHSLQDRRLTSTAVVLLHSPQNPQPEHDLAMSLQQADIWAVPSARLLPARRGAGDERLRTRAAVLSAALSPGAFAELQGLQAGVDPACSPRWFVLRSDGSCGPAARVPAWQQLLAPLAAGLVGAARQAESDRYLCWLSVGDAPQAATTRGSPEQAPDLALAALCSRDAAGRPSIHAASCLGIPCDVPALGARIVEGAVDCDALFESLAAPFWGPSHAPSTDSIPPASDDDGSLALSRVPVLRMDWVDAALWGTLRARAVCEASRSLFTDASGAQQSGLLATTLQHLQDELTADLAAASATSSGMPSEVEWTAELRYRGQASVLSLRGIGPGGPAATPATDLVVRFVAEHQRIYGFSRPECPVELVQLNLRVRL